MIFIISLSLLFLSDSTCSIPFTVAVRTVKMYQLKVIHCELMSTIICLFLSSKVISVKDKSPHHSHG